jgi:hypothetical protein
LIPAEAIAVPNELLPIVFDRLARGDRGEPQEGGEYQSQFEDDYRFVDLTQTAEEVHRQTRAWSFVPPILPEIGPIFERDGTSVRLLRTSLTEVAGGGPDRLRRRTALDRRDSAGLVPTPPAQSFR